MREQCTEETAFLTRENTLSSRCCFSLWTGLFVRFFLGSNNEKAKREKAPNCLKYRRITTPVKLLLMLKCCQKVKKCVYVELGGGTWEGKRVCVSQSEITVGDLSRDANGQWQQQWQRWLGVHYRSRPTESEKISEYCGGGHGRQDGGKWKVQTELHGDWCTVCKATKRRR